MKVLNDNKKSVLSNSKEIRFGINLNSDYSILPTVDIEKIVNEYEQYIKEKKESELYRLSFTINPICSNVLFNIISELVYHEGGDDCIVFNDNDGTDISTIGNFNDYLKYKGKMGNGGKVTRQDLIRDTGFSHASIGPVVYHCGYDIFNNHTLRKKEYKIINKINDNSFNGGKLKENFNTLSDFLRYDNGKVVENITNPLKSEKKKIHTYQIDDVYSFEESINQNLIEKNGWVGFSNPQTLEICNYKNISLNKCMNNNKACEFIDMYPDRSLYSFIPKTNKLRNNRIEPNWDYCLTYPYSNYYNNILVQYENGDISVNGLEAIIKNDIFDESGEIKDNITETINLKTIIKNNFKRGSLIEFVLIGVLDDNKQENEKDEKESIVVLSDVENVINTGVNGRETNYIFSVSSEQIIEHLNKFKTPSKVKIRVRQIINGSLCKYYFRLFKKIPKLFGNGAKIGDMFNTSINKMGFSKNIYSDDIAQILFNDDVLLKGLKDNLGRQISEIFLTIVKNNKGNDLWYNNEDYANPDITFSHCFGNITSGIDIKDSTIYDYNIHKIHNISTSLYGKYNNMYNHIFKPRGEKPQMLEDNITIDNENGMFLGDIVEFSPATIEESVLENVYHRFNTVQREMYNEEGNKFFSLFKEEIAHDDYDLDDGEEFSTVISDYNILYTEENGIVNDEKRFPANIQPEGYYYQPHYNIKLKEFSNEIKQGSHTKIVIREMISQSGDIYEINTAKNYFLEINDELYLYNKYTKEKIIGKVIYVGGSNYTNVKIYVRLNEGDMFEDFTIFKPNVEKPEYAYDLDDGSGYYLWREYLNENEYDINGEIYNYVFTNGAHYINKSINFFLRRQDPLGEYGLGAASFDYPLIQNLSIEAKGKDYSAIDYIEEKDFEIC